MKLKKINKKRNIKKKLVQAFTLLEIMIYLFIFSFFFISVIGVLIAIGNGNDSQLQKKELENVKIFLAEHLADSFQNSDQIVLPTGSGGTELMLAKHSTTSGSVNIDAGNGSDGVCTTSTAVNINTSSCVGRTYPDAVNTTSVVNTKVGSRTIVVSTLPAGLAIGDEILIINLQGNTINYSNVGQYETHLITQIKGTTLTLDRGLINGYDGTSQKIMVQRIPNYSNVTLNNGGSLSINAWDGTKNGVLYIRSSNSVTINNGGRINTSGFGYRMMNTTFGPPYTLVDGPGRGGETYNGFGNDGCSWSGAYYCPDPANGFGATVGNLGHEGGGGGSADGNAPSSGTVGGGGGGGGWNFGYTGGYGGGGGYGTVGAGANSGSGATGGNGGTSSAGGAGNGGGGGVYGVADLSRLYFGSAGGYGDASGGAGCTGCTGGNGGGIVVINTTTLTVNTGGLIKNNGVVSTYVGGGAGGSIKLSAVNITLGSSLVTASGGISNYSGGDGRIAIESAGTLSGTTNPTSNNVQAAGNYYDYKLASNVVTFYTGIGINVAKPLTNSEYVTITSMTFDIVKGGDLSNSGVRVTIGLQAVKDSTIQSTIQTTYTLK